MGRPESKTEFGSPSQIAEQLRENFRTKPNGLISERIVSDGNGRSAHLQISDQGYFVIENITAEEAHARQNGGGLRPYLEKLEAIKKAKERNPWVTTPEKIPPRPEDLPSYEGDGASLRTLKMRYQRKDDQFETVETPEEMFWRVSYALAHAERAYGADDKKVMDYARTFYTTMATKDGEPNSPTLMNAGTGGGTLSACFVLPIEDSMEGIMDAVTLQAYVQKWGGGTGFSGARLRPRGSYIKSTHGRACGPVQVLRELDRTSEMVTQGGKREGANMFILPIWHPDIIEFIDAKKLPPRATDEAFNLARQALGGIGEEVSQEVENTYRRAIRDKTQVTCFNISVAMTNEAIEALKSDGRTPLRDPSTKEQYLWTEYHESMDRKQVEGGNFSRQEDKPQTTPEEREAIYGTKIRRAGEPAFINMKPVFDRMVSNAWDTGDPGLFFIDRANQSRSNYNPDIEMIEATNPCGEVPLYPFNVCNLGSENIGNFVKLPEEGSNGNWRELVDWDRLGENTKVMVRMLDNIVTVNEYPDYRISKKADSGRVIGLGVMGVHDAMIKAGVPYNSEKALEFAEGIMSFIQSEADKASEELAEERGPFPMWEHSIYKDGEPMRNGFRTVIAPTGTIAIIATCSTSIEPVWGIVQEHSTAGRIVNDNFERVARERGFWSEGLEEAILAGKKPSTIDEVPEDIKELFTIAEDIPWQQHVRIQEAFQKYTDNAVSKTINMPADATVDDVRGAYLMACESSYLKGMTIYRDKSKIEQVLTKPAEEGDSLLVKPAVMSREIKLPSTIESAQLATKYRIETGVGPAHITVTDRLFQSKEDPNKLYWYPWEAFNNKQPLGDQLSVSFAVDGLDRTYLFQLGADLDKLVKNWLSTESSRQYGVGSDNQVTSLDNAFAQIVLYHSLGHGIFEFVEEPTNGKIARWYQAVRPEDLEPVSPERFAELKAGGVLKNGSGTGAKIEAVVDKTNELTGRHCPDCGSTNVDPTGGKCGADMCRGCGWEAC